MGIKGLNSFIHRYPSSLLENIEVSDTAIVIDGSELLYHLYFDSGNVDVRCGGEYTGLRANTKDFFAVLEKCNITSYVVFDGFKSENNIERYVKKRSENLALMKEVVDDEGANVETRAKPLMAKRVLLQTLCEIDVPWIVVPGDGDAELAAIANDMKAMVLASDTDFCIFPLNHGFLIFNDFEWEQVRNSNKTACTGKIFRRETFSRTFGTPGMSIAFLEPLMSQQDGLRGVDFERFLKNIQDIVRVPQQLRNRGRFYRPNLVECLLLWLGKNYKNEDEMIDHIRRKVENLPMEGFRECLQVYNNLPNVSQFVEILLTGRRPDHQFSLSCFEEPHEINVPLSLLPVVIDDQNKASSHGAARCIRKAIYEIGLFKRNLRTGGGESAASQHILEMDRIGFAYGTRDVAILVEEERMTSICADMEQYEVDASETRDEIMQARKEFLLHEILQNDGYDSLGTLGAENILLEATIKYWANGQDQTTPPDGVRKAIAFTFASSYHDVNSATYPQIFQQVGNSGFNKTALHHSSQWQTLVSEAMRLNHLLGNPLEEPLIGKLFSGKLFQQAHEFFLCHKDIPDNEAAVQLFGDSSDANKFFLAILQLF